MLKAAPRFSSREKAALAALALAAGIVLVAGWRLFWFLTDDAYISFRYASNLVSGHGLVWNAAPFRPVEGYSNFLWVMLLAGVWRWTGLEPPTTANAIALLFSLFSLLLFSLFLLNMRWRRELARFRVAFLALSLLGLLSNRTFLAWSSSGLETAMYNFFLLLWTFCLLRLPAGSSAWFFLTSLSAALLTLTRPDGVLFLLGTLLAGLSVAWKGPRPGAWRSAPWVIPPAALAVGHAVWRRLYYGEWLPNTYYAKIGSPWPESGWRYLLSFVLEYALWLFVLAAALVLLQRRRGAAERGESRPEGTPQRLAWWAGGILATQFLYYTFIAGGDHFEYRVYSHLFFFFGFAWIWLLNRSRLRPVVALAALLISILCSWPVPWSHWRLTRQLSTRDETYMMRVPIAAQWPAGTRWYAEGFDRLQDWLIRHFVCMRHQEHKVLRLCLERDVLPPRGEGARISPRGFPVMALGGGIGIMGWTLPHVYLIDLYGLNDHVIARAPFPQGETRRMAHERRPPPGYVACFSPNVILLPGRKIQVLQRREELGARHIMDCEAAWWQRAKKRAP